MCNRMNSFQLSKSYKEQEYNIIRQIIYNKKYDPSVLNNNNRIKHTKNKIRMTNTSGLIHIHEKGD